MVPSRFPQSIENMANDDFLQLVQFFFYSIAQLLPFCAAASLTVCFSCHSSHLQRHVCPPLQILLPFYTPSKGSRLAPHPDPLVPHLATVQVVMRCPPIRFCAPDRKTAILSQIIHKG